MKRITPLSTYDNDTWYRIELNKEKNANQKTKAVKECSLNGLMIIPKNTTNINRATLPFKKKLVLGTNPKSM